MRSMVKNRMLEEERARKKVELDQRQQEQLTFKP